MKRLQWAIGGAALLFVIAGVFLSSSAPDGLERSAADLGFLARGASHPSPFLQSGWAAEVSLALASLCILYGFGVLLGRRMKRKK